MGKLLPKVLPGEDQAEFDRLIEACRNEQSPQNIHEDFLVEQMAWSRWRITRYQRLEFIARENGDVKAAEQMHRIASSARKSHDQALRALKTARKVPRRGRVQAAPAPPVVPPPADTAYRA
jgi:hypothetical protein